MADIPTPTPAPKVVAKKVVEPAYSPWAFRVTKLRANAEEFVKTLAPEGTPNPAQVERVKTHLLAILAGLPPEINAVEIMVEANANQFADQVNVIVWKKTF